MPRKARRQAQYSFTDPESRILRVGGWIRAGLQHADRRRNPVFQLIVGQAGHVSQRNYDKQQLVPLLERIERIDRDVKTERSCGQDNGYCSDENLKYLNKRKIEGFVATGKQEPQHRTARTLQTSAVTEGASRVERMERKLATQVGAAVYATRKFIVEPVV